MEKDKKTDFYRQLQDLNYKIKIFKELQKKSLEEEKSHHASSFKKNKTKRSN